MGFRFLVCSGQLWMLERDQIVYTQFWNHLPVLTEFIKFLATVTWSPLVTFDLSCVTEVAGLEHCQLRNK